MHCCLSPEKNRIVKAIKIETIPSGIKYMGRKPVELKRSSVYLSQSKILSRFSLYITLPQVRPISILIKHISYVMSNYLAQGLE